MLMVKVAVAALAVFAVAAAVLGGSSLTLGLRKLIPSLEQVTFSVSNNRSYLFASALRIVVDLLNSLWRKLRSPPGLSPTYRALIAHLSSLSMIDFWTSSSPHQKRLY